MERLLTPDEAASLLRVSVYTIKEYARKGIVPAIKVGGVWRFPESGLMKPSQATYPLRSGAQDAIAVKDAVTFSEHRKVTAKVLRTRRSMRCTRGEKRPAKPWSRLEPDQSRARWRIWSARRRKNRDFVVTNYELDAPSHRSRRPTYSSCGRQCRCQVVP
jgi:excisionase family DNA binding protein